MPVPFIAFCRWLQDGKPAPDTGDIESVESIAADDDKSETKTPRTVVRWLGREDSEVIDHPNKIRGIRPGDLIVIPAMFKGWDTLGYKPPDEDSPVDRGEEAHLRARARAVLRLHRHVFAEWPQAARERLTALFDQPGKPENRPENRLESEPELLADELKEILQDLSNATKENSKTDNGEPDTADWLAEIAGHLAEEAEKPRFDRCIQRHPCGGLVITSIRRNLGTSQPTGCGCCRENKEKTTNRANRRESGCLHPCGHSRRFV